MDLMLHEISQIKIYGLNYMYNLTKKTHHNHVDTANRLAARRWMVEVGKLGKRGQKVQISP